MFVFKAERDWHLTHGTVSHTSRGQVGEHMQLIFGIGCDSSAYPEFPGNGRGAVNAAVVGPRGLVQALEMQLGLTGPNANEAVRIAAYANKTKALLTASPSLFFADSFASDPWATAKALLSWRDELVADGWNLTPSGSFRIDALALIEADGQHLPSGFSDRLQKVTNALKAEPKLSLASLQLVAPRPLLPPRFERLVAGLERCGVEVVPPSFASQPAAGDLAKAQDFVTSNVVGSLVSDGSVTIIEADTSLLAAEAVAEWLAAGTEEDLAGTVVIDPDGDTALLDGALGSRGLPALGRSAASPWRGALQVLPMAFAASWAPFNPTAMLDLLLLPRPPIGRYAANQLARSLSREPGPGGAAWQRAWQRIEARLLNQFKDAEFPDKEVAARLERWREWTTPSGATRANGMSAETARKIAGRVADWAVKTDGGTGDPLLLSLAAAASAMAQAIDMLGLSELPALTIDRLIEQVLADGAVNPGHIAKGGGLRSIDCPEAIWEPAPRIIWWNFRGPGSKVRPSPWTKSELLSLEKVGCLPESSQKQAERISWSYANAVRMASDRLLFVRPALAGGEETTSHPLAHQLQPLLAKPSASIVWRAEQLLDSADLFLSDRRIKRISLPITAPPQTQAQWSVPAPMIEKITGRKESATSFERLIDCQMRWLILDVLGISGGRFAEIPGPDQLLGNLAHEIANQVFEPGVKPDSQAVKAKAEALFDDLVAAIAAPLLQPQFAAELARARVKVPQALAHLSRLLEQRNIEVVGTELERAGEFPSDLSVAGRLDMVVQHQTHGIGVIDLKWTKSEKRRRTELSEGNAIQLATYGAIADESHQKQAVGAYYLLNQRRLIGPTGAFVADEEIETARSLEATWEAIIGTWKAWKDLAQSGTGIAVGVPGADAFAPRDLGFEVNKEPCTYCELTSLCRVAAENK